MKIIFLLVLLKITSAVPKKASETKPYSNILFGVFNKFNNNSYADEQLVHTMKYFNFTFFAISLRTSIEAFFIVTY